MVDTKTTDNATTLIQFLVQILEHQSPNLLKLNEDIPHVSAASKIPYQNLQAELNSLLKDYREVKKSMELFNEKDKFTEIMNVTIFLIYIH